VNVTYITPISMSRFTEFVDELHGSNYYGAPVHDTNNNSKYFTMAVNNTFTEHDCGNRK
jgi:hypothetical protein